MKLSAYFEKAQGMGILATADSDGVVDLALHPDGINIILVLRLDLSLCGLDVRLEGIGVLAPIMEQPHQLAE